MSTGYRAALVTRLRDQVRAAGHRWVDVAALLLEAAEEIERIPGPKTPQPFAWLYVSKKTGEETFTYQPPDRLLFKDDYVMTPLYRLDATGMPSKEKT